MLRLPIDVAAALEAEAQAACMRPSQVIRAWLAKRLREQAERSREEAGADALR